VIPRIKQGDKAMNKIYKFFTLIIMTIALVIAAEETANAQIGWQKSAGQSLIDALKVKEPLTFCNEKVPLKENDVRERLEREMLVSLQNSDDVILWLKRAYRYFPHIEIVLRENRLPDDLKYIVIAESALKPLAASHKGAVGFWQFIESTGKRYNITVNSDIDERRNFFIATDAALAYLKDLYSIFNSWTLAAAAYNMGEDGLKTEILMQQTNNYYLLHLNQETQRYVFRILAAKIIMSDPEKYGFHLSKDDLYPPLQFDRVEISADNPVPIQVIAAAANTYFKIIKELNPHLKGYDLPPGRHSVLIPKGTADGFSGRYENLLNQWHIEKENATYTVQKGDSIYTIAKNLNVSVKAIMIWNDLAGVNQKLSPGDKLVIFTRNRFF